MMLSVLEKQDIKEQVARGEKYLDKNFPGWEKKIDLSVFDINMPCHCILGQLGENYYTHDRKCMLGFSLNAYYSSMDIAWDYLQKVWVGVIKRRQGITD